MAAIFPDKIQLTGSDYFQLLLDYHMRQQGQTGNVVRLQLDFEQKIPLSTLQSLLAKNVVLQKINALQLECSPFQIPFWKNVELLKPVALQHHQNLSENDFQQKVLNRDLLINSGSLYFDLVEKKDGKSSLVISAHHALFDQRGMLNLVKSINETQGIPLLEKTKTARFWEQLSNTVSSTFFLLKSPPKPLAKFQKNISGKISPAKFCTIKFSETETAAIDKNCFKQGARLAKSPFYLAATTRAVNLILQKRSSQDLVYWLPVPQDQRPRGSAGSLLGNRLSFLFYKIPSQELANISEATAELTLQMKTQIRNDIPRKYSNLLTLFRRLPLKIYLRLVQLPTNGAISSFSFSDLGEAGGSVSNFCGMEVEELLNYPPVPCPPGLTVVFMRFRGKLRIVAGYAENAISAPEITLFENQLRRDLLNIS